MTTKLNTDVVPVTDEAAQAATSPELRDWEDIVSCMKTTLEDAINVSTAANMLIADNNRMRVALEKLAKLGNGTCYGNSIGNNIAKQALGEQS